MPMRMPDINPFLDWLEIEAKRLNIESPKDYFPEMYVNQTSNSEGRPFWDSRPIDREWNEEDSHDTPYHPGFYWWSRDLRQEYSFHIGLIDFTAKIVIQPDFDFAMPGIVLTEEELIQSYNNTYHEYDYSLEQFLKANKEYMREPTDEEKQKWNKDHNLRDEVHNYKWNPPMPC